MKNSKKFNKYRVKKHFSNFLTYFFSVLLVLFCIFPFYWMVSSSLKSSVEFYAVPPTFFPKLVTLEQYIKLLKETFFTNWFKNTALVTLVSTFLSVFVATLGAYSLTRGRFRARETIANMVLLTYMFPPILMALPLYLLLARTRLINSLPGLMITYLTIALPYSLWMLRAFFQTIPYELEEAGMIDGATRFQVIWKIVLPMALPGILATSLFTLITTWNEYLYALLFISSENLKTLSVGLTGFLTKHGIRWDYIMPGSVLSSVPIFVFFFYIQKYLVEGWGGGAIKG
ncbi:MAG TPA: carbohydrate ABC transporter permease [Defluviitaleaceae bacterium]|nr:carbohydrate ABC transporter permease [Methanothermobacter sp.]HPT76676.1 carbohydrate ABC transporter permease [Defluviitaleaceae bacterium]